MADKPKITYVRGRGLAEVSRLIFAVQDVETTEEHITTNEEFQKIKATGKLMFNQLPLIEIDGLCLIESQAQGNYLGHKYNMLGKTDLERGRVQMLFAGSNSFNSVSGPFWFFMPAEARADAKKSAIEKGKTRYLPVFEKVLTENGTGFLVGSEATIADCALFNILSCMKEMPEYNNILDNFPQCKAFVDTFSAIPGVKKYLESPRRFPPPDDAYAKEVRAALY
ncbi:hypothetical protein BSL78_17017 [Apostichopus japonicus]|uniref:Uncharacterized protein n=1 Tax=Stichopus japonicus TaxID=307972 RepID=A0A2G8KDM6_STIJA|nr:hypothetical protein BSL78_17017 [Apostichopus japonicus]